MEYPEKGKLITSYQEGIYTLDIDNKTQEENKKIISTLIENINNLKHNLRSLKSEEEVKSGLENYFIIYTQIKIVKNFINTYSKTYNDQYFTRDLNKIEQIKFTHPFYKTYSQEAELYSEGKGPLYFYDKTNKRIATEQTPKQNSPFSRPLSPIPSSSKTVFFDTNQEPLNLEHLFDKLNVNDNVKYTSTPLHANPNPQVPTFNSKTTPNCSHSDEFKDADFKFDGSIEKFPFWWKVMERVLSNPNYTEDYKIYYLLKQTNEKFHAEIWNQSVYGLEAVRNALLAKFRDPTKLTASLFKLAKGLPIPIDQESAADFKNGLVTIKNTAEQQELNAFSQLELFKLIYNNLPQSAKQNFANYAFTFDIITPNLGDLVEFASKWTCYQNILPTKTNEIKNYKSIPSRTFNPKNNFNYKNTYKNRIIPNNYYIQPVNNKINPNQRNFQKNKQTMNVQKPLPITNYGKRSYSSDIPTPKRKCNFCEVYDHWSTSCQFKTLDQKRQIINQKDLCIHCLCPTHQSNLCRRQVFCYKCGEKHHHSICDNPKIFSDKANTSKLNIRLVKEESTTEGYCFDIFSDDDDENYSKAKPRVNVMNILQNCQIQNNSTIFNIFPEMWIPVVIHGKTFEALVDTGSDINIMSEQMAEKLNVKKIPINMKIETFNQPITIKFATEIPIIIGKTKKKTKFAIHTKSNIDLLIGRSILAQFNLITIGAKEIYQEDENGEKISLNLPIEYKESHINIITELQSSKFKKELRRVYIPTKYALDVIRKLQKRKNHIEIKQMNKHYNYFYCTPKVHEMIHQVCQECLTCIATKYQRGMYGTISTMEPIHNSFNFIYIVTVGGFADYSPKFNTVVNKQKYIHIAIDAHSRFVWIKTSKSQSATDFIDLLKQISNVQTPKKVVSDRYSALKSKEFKRFLFENKIEILHTPVNHPSSNGMVERVNQTLAERMRHKIFESTVGGKKLNRSWTTIARECVREYNDTVHTITKFPPLYLLTGIDNNHLYTNLSLSENRKIAVTNTQNSFNTESVRINRRRTNPEFTPGEQVYVNITSKLNRGKLDPLFEGPFTIEKQISDHIYAVESEKGEKRECHISQMKKFKPLPNIFHNITSYVTHSTTPPHILILLTLLTTINAIPIKYETTSPYLWQMTNYQAMYNSSLTIISLLQKNPCTSHKHFGKAISHETFHCNQTYEAYLHTIKSKCEHTNKFSFLNVKTQKTRRDVTSMVEKTIINGVNLPSMGQDLHVNENLIDYTKDYISELRLKILQIEGLEAYKTMQSKKEMKIINETLRRLEEMTGKEQKEKTEMQRTMFLNQELRIHTVFLKFFLNKFIEGSFGEEFTYLFPNIKINTTSPAQTWKPLQCEWMKNSTLILKFLIPKIIPKIEIYQVNPFTLYKQNYNQICTYQYIDTKFIAFNRNLKCIIPLPKFTPKKKHDLIMLMNEKCQQKIGLNQKWKKIECVDKQDITTDQMIQIKVDENFYYIYAPYQNLTLDDKEINNENAIYKIPLSTIFKINGKLYNHNILKLNFTTNLNEEILEYLNLTKISKIHFNDLNTSELDHFIENEEKFESFLNQPFTKFQPIKFFFQKQSSIWTSVFIILFFILVCWFIYKKRKRRLQQQAENAFELSNSIMKSLIKQR